jgi:hypothetical protein
MATSARSMKSESNKRISVSQKNSPLGADIHSCIEIAAHTVHCTNDPAILYLADREYCFVSCILALHKGTRLEHSNYTA